MRLTLPYPPSTNRAWRHGKGGTFLSPEARSYRTAAAWLARGIVPLAGNLHVALTLHPKLTRKGMASRRRMDLDNALKVTLDALNGIAWTDDSQIVRLEVDIGPAVAHGAITVSACPTPFSGAAANPLTSSGGGVRTPIRAQAD